MKKVKLFTLILAGILAVSTLTAYGYGKIISSRKTIIESDVCLVLYDKNQHEELGTFQLGEKVVLFLTDDKGTRPDKNDFGYGVLGGFQGKFKEENGKLKNEKFTFDVATFAQELNQIEKNNKTNGLKKLTDVPGIEI